MKIKWIKKVNQTNLVAITFCVLILKKGNSEKVSTKQNGIC